MATRYWVGGVGNWDASTTTNWASTSGGAGGVSVPTSSDDVIFDANSGGLTVTVTATANCNSLTMGAYTGILNTNAQTVNVTGTFNISGAGSRTLILGASTVNCALWTAATTTNLTFTPNASSINVTMNGQTNFGGLTYYAFSLIFGAGVSQAVAGVGTFTNLTITGTSSTNCQLGFVNSQTITGNLTITGYSTSVRPLIYSFSVGSQVTLTCTGASVNYSNADFQDIIISSGTLGTNTYVGDCGNNSGITFTTPTTQHWTNANGGNWGTAGNWTSRVPLPQDAVVMDKAFGVSKTVTNDVARLGNSITWTGATWTTSLTWTFSTTQSTFYGDFVGISGLTTSTNYLVCGGRSGQSFTSNGMVFTNFGIYINNYNATVTLQDTLNMTGLVGIIMQSGTLDANNNNINTVGVTTSGSVTTAVVKLGSGTWTLTGSSTPWNILPGVTISNPSSSTIKITNSTNSNLTFKGNNQTYNNVWFSRGTSTGSITLVYSNTFNDFKDDGSVAHSLLFTAGTSTTVTTFSVSGTAGNLITLNSTSTATYSLIKTGGGVISSDYLNIQHSVATPSNTWFAGNNSVNNQATATAGSGWGFTTPTINYNLTADNVNYTTSIGVVTFYQGLTSFSCSVSLSDTTLSKNLNISFDNLPYTTTIGNVTANRQNSLSFGSLGVTSTLYDAALKSPLYLSPLQVTSTFTDAYLQANTSFNVVRQAARDENRATVAMAVLASDQKSAVMLRCDPVKRLLEVSNGTTGSYPDNQRAIRDENRITVMMAVSGTDGKTLVPIYMDDSFNLLIKST